MSAEKVLKNMIGIRIFEEKEDGTIKSYRVKGYSKSGTSAICIEEKTNTLYYFGEPRLKEFKMLESDGMFMISTVTMGTRPKITQDVIISISKTLELQAGFLQPYAICRQSVTDVFYNIVCSDVHDQIAGLSVNRDNCPANFDMGVMMQCTKVNKTEVVYFYREDTIDDILKFINTRTYDLVLSTLYLKHARTCGDPKAMIGKEHKGWCKDLKTLLRENNFQSDIDEMLGITSITFDLSKFIFEKPLPDDTKGGYYTVSDDLKLWLSGTFRIAIADLTILEYEHDINLADLNNARYFILRDCNNKLYICVYTLNGEYLESDLQDAYEKKSFMDEWRLDFVDKYKKSRKIDSIN